MVATSVDDFIALRNPGDFVLEQGTAGSKVTMVCPSCWSRCHSIVGVVSENPLSLTDTVVCHGCLAEYWVEDGKVRAAA